MISRLLAFLLVALVAVSPAAAAEVLQVRTGSLLQVGDGIEGLVERPADRRLPERSTHRCECGRRHQVAQALLQLLCRKASLRLALSGRASKEQDDEQTEGRIKLVSYT